MTVVGVVHGHHVGNHIRDAEEPGEVRRRSQSALGLQQVHRVGDVIESHRISFQRGAVASKLYVFQAGAASASAMQWLGRRS